MSSHHKEQQRGGAVGAIQFNPATSLPAPKSDAVTSRTREIKKKKQKKKERKKKNQAAPARTTALIHFFLFFFFLFFLLTLGTDDYRWVYIRGVYFWRTTRGGRTRAWNYFRRCIGRLTSRSGKLFGPGNTKIL